MKKQRLFRTFTWMDRAIILCIPGHIVSFLVFTGIVLLNEASEFARILTVLFTLLLTSVGMVLLIHLTDIATTLFRKAHTSSDQRMTRRFAGYGINVCCVLLVLLLIIALSRLGVLVGADAVLALAETPLVVLLVWRRLR